MVVHLIMALITVFDIYGNGVNLEGRAYFWKNLFSPLENLDSKLREASWLLLPIIQLAVGISHPSWISLPYFIGSCVGLVDWSLNSDCLGLFRWWNYFLPYAVSNIIVLYIYQLPVEFPDIFEGFAGFIGLYKISSMSDWSENCYGLFLLLFYLMLACIRCDLAEAGNIIPSNDNNLAEHLLPSSHFFLIRQSRSGLRHGNVLSRGAVFRTFTINFFTYGFPISLFALAYWSFQFASLLSFGLITYVGYILFVFPSLFDLHRLNSLLLIFILSWATSTYVFNVAFTFYNKKIQKDREIWETIGLWHYSFPDTEETKVLIIATIVWLFSKCSRAVVMTIIFLTAVKPGFIHALYIIFFLLYLLRPTINWRMRQALILLCEVHFALLYILQLNLFAEVLKSQESLPVKMFSQLGLLEYDSTGDFSKIVLLACFCVIHNHGFEFIFPSPGRILDIVLLMRQQEDEKGQTRSSDDADHPNKNFSGVSEGSGKWNKKRVIFLRKERLQMQKTLLVVYMKFWTENIFNLFGLELNMIILLLCSFAILNAISLVYIAALAACILMKRLVIQRLWPIFVLSFASVLILEYLASCTCLTSPKKVDSWEVDLSCHDCWKNSNVFFDHCLKCWLGIIVDDHRMLVSYWAVFMISCFKLRADQLSNLSNSHMYQQILSFRKSTCVLSDLSFETKCMWTSLDFLRLECYCHLLDLVLSLVLVTGTLEYDILHLGYLGFALAFFRMRLEILKKKKQIFNWLRVYNFVLIVLSLAYQSPFVGDASEGKCDTSDYIYEIIGFYKYDYGFRITSRSALVEIIIFALVSLQSYMFASNEFDYVSKYLEAEQIRAALTEQEKKAAWKTKQLLHIRRNEELKNQRNLQVEKMKAEMLNLQTELQRTTSSQSEGLGWTTMSSVSSYNGYSCKEENFCRSFDSLNFEITASRAEKNDLKDSFRDIREDKEVNLDNFNNLDRKETEKLQDRENPLKSALQLFGDGVSHVQSIGNLAVNNLVNLLNIDVEELISEDKAVENGEYYEIESQNMRCQGMELTFSMHSDCGTAEALHAYISMLLRYMWAQMRSHNDIVCYCCFVLIFLWNFSLLSMFYPAGLFLYALCVHAGPSYMFWVLMLIYTELSILLQYLYQINIQHCGFILQFSFLQELGFPGHKVTSSLVTSNWPLFLVYLFTLLQSSITSRDCEWAVTREFGSFRKRNSDLGEACKSSNWLEEVERMLLSLIKVTKLILNSLYRYWKSLVEGAETPPYFVQLSMRVEVWPEDGIQPERVGSRINRLLKIVHNRRSRDSGSNHYAASRIRVQSIEQSPENPNIALAVLEVLYASSLVDGIPVEWHHSLTPAADVAEELLEGQRGGIFEEIGFPYSILSIIWGGKKEIDLYAYVFCADLVVFFLVAIFYQSVIKNKSEFLEVYQLEDQFPKEFVFILMIIFFLIVLDRVIYLRIYATGKVILYIFNLVLFTFAVTKYAWSTEPSQQHSGRFALRSIYLMKTISLALQAVQIRYGIPNRGTLYQQFLTSSVCRINYLAFRVYRALPFLHELRCVLDWSCTTTSLTMYDWLKLEDIHSSLFLAKCDADLNRANHKQGQKQTKMTKFCNGICLFLVLIGVIWAPMLMYSSGNPTNIANPIKDASVRVDIKTVSGRLTLFETTLCKMLSGEDLDIRANIDPRGYLKTYDENDVQLICCQADASSMWLVPPVVQARFIQSLGWSMDILFSWKFIRDRPKGKEVVKYERVVQDHDSPRVEQVTEVLHGKSNSFAIYDIYPRYFRVTGSGDVRLLEEAVELVSANLTLHRANPGWWSFDDINPLGVSDYCGPAGPVAVIVSEETPQGILGETLSHSSIWGLYITFVLAVGRFIRLQCSDLRMRIPFENLPSCDRLLAICENIYAARAEGELEVEEVLYWTLVKIYRSPHMLLEYTKPD